MTSKIVAKGDAKVIIEWDSATLYYRIYHTTLEAYLKDGIYIPHYLQSEFQQKQVVYLPDNPTKAEFDLFIKALKFYLSSELYKAGYCLVEPTEDLRKIKYLA